MSESIETVHKIDKSVSVTLGVLAACVTLIISVSQFMATRDNETADQAAWRVNVQRDIEAIREGMSAVHTNAQRLGLLDDEIQEINNRMIGGSEGWHRRQERLFWDEFRKLNGGDACPIAIPSVDSIPQ